MKKYVTFVITVILVLSLGATLTWAKKNGVYKTVIEEEVEVIPTELNVRTGPGTAYPVVDTVKQGDVLTVVGALDDWYVVHLPDNSIGVVSNKYVKTSKMGAAFSSQGASDDETATDTNQEVAQMFELINKSRSENNLPLYEWDEKLNRIAQLKAIDMTNNQYFSHNSMVYGTPFSMLKQMGVLYKSASENLARNSSVVNAHLDIMSSPAHRVNIINTQYNKVGIGISESSEWGKIIVQLFVEE